MTTHTTVECYECGKTVPETTTNSLVIHPSPFGNGRTIYLCDGQSDEKEKDENKENDESDNEEPSCWERFFDGTSEFPYIECPGCDRYVCLRNPGNGYMGQFRTAPIYENDDDENDSDENDSNDICLKCYEDRIIEQGQPHSDFDGKNIRGGMFYNPVEWIALGYEAVPDFSNRRIASSENAAQYNKHARELIEQGAHVLTGWDSIGMGLEGYVTMFARFLNNRKTKKAKKDCDNE